MLKRKILFLIIFLTVPLSSCSLKRNYIKTNQIENPKTFEEKKISNEIKGKEKKTLGEELKINETTFKQNTPMGMIIENDKKFKSISNSRNNLYLNFSVGYTSLKNYDVYNTSTNKAIWDDRYT